MVQEKKKRRQIILPKTSQTRMLITLLAVSGLVAIIMLVFVYLDYYLRLSASYPALGSIQSEILIALVVINLVAVIFCALLIVLFTHRIAGPIYNFRQILRGIAQGDLSRQIIFRKGDFLQEIANDGNLALDYLRQEIGEMQLLSENVVKSVAESGGNPTFSDESNILFEEACELRDQLGKFILDEDQKVEA